jgi:predicted PurR-regulated permease PerM
MNQDIVNKSVLILLLLVISALFLSMIQQFLMAIFLAGLFSALVRPVYFYFEKLYGGRRHLASLTTFVVLIPFLFLLGVVVGQAIDVGQSVTPWIKQTMSDHGTATEYLKSLPFYDKILPYQQTILQKAGQAIGAISKFLVDGLSAATVGTVHFVFMAFVMLYSMFFFLIDGNKLVEKMLYYLPLQSSDENRMLEKFTSVTRAMLKGTFLIGVLQGGLAGLAFGRRLWRSCRLFPVLVRRWYGCRRPSFCLPVAM